MSAATVDRATVERLVREAIGSLNGNGRATPPSKPKVVVNVSARHAHVTQEDLERLFGKGHKLTPMKALYQDGFFAAEETLTMIGPRHRTITGLRILGPCRDHSQVELAFTDSIFLGLDIPVRKSGDIKGSPGCYLMGPAGMVQMREGVIRHERHVHMGPADCTAYGVKDGDRLNLRVKSDCGAVLEGLLVRAGAGIKLEVHIDTDEGNAVNYPKATGFELFK
jgi:putative phosphotransacetylase